MEICTTHLFIPSSGIDPPQYSGPTVSHPQPQTLSTFPIPTFEEVMSLYEFEDSMRLPTYQARQLSRFHPYQRFRPSPTYDEDRYTNTIYDEEYVPLEVPARVGPVRPTPPLYPALVAPADAIHIVGPLQVERDRDDEHHQRIYRLRMVIVDFLLALKRATEAAARARQTPARALLVEQELTALTEAVEVIAAALPEVSFVTAVVPLDASAPTE